MDRVLNSLEDDGYLLNSRRTWCTRRLSTLAIWVRTRTGNGFGVSMTQTAYFRPHNRSEDIANLYLVGANTQPGAGTPAVMMSAKITAQTIWDDHGARVSERHLIRPDDPVLLPAHSPALHDADELEGSVVP